MGDDIVIDDLQRQINYVRRSVDSLEKSLAAYTKHKEKPYQFKAGDVARNENGQVRVVYQGLEDLEGELLSMDRDALCQTSTHGNQNHFEKFGYVKIGELEDYLPKDEDGNDTL